MSTTPFTLFDSVAQSVGLGADWTDLNNVLAEAGLAQSDQISGGTPSRTEDVELTVDLSSFIPEGSLMTGANFTLRASESPIQGGGYSFFNISLGGIDKQVQYGGNTVIDVGDDLAGWGITEPQLRDIIDGNTPVKVWFTDGNHSTDIILYYVRIQAVYDSPQTEVLAPPVVF